MYFFNVYFTYIKEIKVLLSLKKPAEFLFVRLPTSPRATGFNLTLNGMQYSLIIELLWILTGARDFNILGQFYLKRTLKFAIGGLANFFRHFEHLSPVFLGPL